MVGKKKEEAGGDAGGPRGGASGGSVISRKI
jgi:hypothetical protein